MGTGVWIGAHTAALAVLAATAGAQVKGETHCPGPAEVEAALAGLVPASEAEPPVAELRSDGDAVVLSLSSQSGKLIAEKRLDPTLPCAERARTAAVAVAAWRSRLAPGSAVLPLENAPPRAVPAVEANPDQNGSAPAKRRLRFEPGAGVAAALDRSDVVPAVRLELALRRGSSRIMPMLAFRAEGSRTIGLAPGSASWHRFGAELGLAMVHAWPSVWIAERIGAELSLLDPAGRGFPNNANGMTLDPGISAAFRVGLRAGQSAPWIELTGTVWPRHQTLYVGGTGADAALPRAEALIGLGASLGSRP